MNLQQAIADFCHVRSLDYAPGEWEQEPLIITITLDSQHELVLELSNDELLVLLLLPECYPNEQRMASLLAMVHYREGWPVTIMAGLTDQDMRLLLLIRLPVQDIDGSDIETAVTTLQQVEQRWMSQRTAPLLLSDL
ncbi:hypothetical protein ACVBEF_14945 [Glaciimonas sp. GG7]